MASVVTNVATTGVPDEALLPVRRMIFVTPILINTTARMADTDNKMVIRRLSFISSRLSSPEGVFGSLILLDIGQLYRPDIKRTNSKAFWAGRGSFVVE